MSGKRKAKYRTRTNTKRNKGLTLPGYNYLGPFNDVDDTPPTNATDAAARRHDIAYSALGKRAYYTYSKADEDFLKEIEDHEGIGPSIAKKVFKAKKKLATWGVLPTDMSDPKTTYPLRSQKRITQYFQAKKGYVEKAIKLRNAAKKPPVTEVSVLNSPSTSNMAAAGTGSGNTGLNKETPVDEVINVTRGPEDYTFVSLPYLQRTEHMAERYHTYKYIYRLTSPYDVSHDTSLIDTNTGTGAQNEREQAATDTNVVSARWYDYYKGLYNYYHVVSCRYHFVIENLALEPIWVHVLVVNEEDVPTKATNDDIRLWRGVKSYYLGAAGHAIKQMSAGTGDAGAVEDADDAMAGGKNDQNEQSATNTAANGGNFEDGNVINTRTAINMVKISGTYQPGDHKRTIHLDDDVETWTAVTTNPKLPERLMILIRPDTEFVQENSAVDSNRPLYYRMSTEMEYLTEFKELKSELRYPIMRQPLTVNIPQNATTATG